jgi:hypothetical protein
MDKAGDRWWPVLGSIYMVTAVKRVRGMRLVGTVRKRVEVLRPALAPAASRVGRVQVEPSIEAVSARIAARDAANDPPALLGGDGVVAIDGGVR